VAVAYGNPEGSDGPAGGAEVAECRGFSLSTAELGLVAKAGEARPTPDRTAMASAEIIARLFRMFDPLHSVNFNKTYTDPRLGMSDKRRTFSCRLLD
jgi:hypothetical protein